ncbi:Por secretion system C-terminal sorting domain-containing protein [Pustulibacterium marinum]|uniref:Por secretion system C-terminal sorting domain-containing protein n=2 Tax=Pustulibacterium marinum TaxID=1224947 RepID=A0A1I7EU96_9FLAO|nr:Por secretion system C-terminal sorting domain-containing protein [Pustulibacterium marinum]
MLFLILMSTSISSAQSNQYLHFDGTDDYTQFDNASSYLYGSSSITMAGWFYTDELIYGQGMMSIRGGGTGNGQMYVLQLSNGALECRLVTSSNTLYEVTAPEGTIVAGQWQHIAWVYAGFTVRLYIDGELIGSSFAPGSGYFASDDRPFTVGKSLLSGYNFIYKGRADEVSLWNKALSQTEIQDMMDNELDGDEEDLVVYYKFNQGTPGGDNTSITQVLAQSGETSKNSTLYNFALTGETSNFNGTLDDNFQVITFNDISDKLTTDEPFTIAATSTSGLDVTYEVVSGPATVDGNTVTLDGTAGEVTLKASQGGNETYEPATDVYTSFEVLDPNGILVTTDVLHPLAGNVYASSLIPMKVAIRAEIEYPELFSVSTVTATIDNEDVTLTNHGNGYYTGWWTPSSFGNHNLEVNADNNYSATNTTSFSFNLSSSASDETVNATTDVWVSADYPTLTVESDLPSYVDSYDEILGTLYIDCPDGGCDPWDRVSSIEAQGKDGEWYEIIRYLTPYGVSCTSSINLTDFKSILKGKTKFRINLSTQGNGFLYTLELAYSAGVDANPYGNIQKLWYQTYQFGDPADLQPTEEFNLEYPENTNEAKIKLVSSGHGWGENNTGNAAEFQANTHHIWVNDAQTFSQYNWNTCSPNPDGCSPQSGTWEYNRAGWCPGSIAQFFDYDMTSYISENGVDLKYIFDQSYTDYCHPNNPDCISGVTCTDCSDTFNPHLVVSSYLISFGSSPLETMGTQETPEANYINIYPNPSSGLFYVNADVNRQIKNIQVIDLQGRIIRNIAVTDGVTTTEIDIRNQATGVYMLTITEANGTSITKRVIKE